MQSGPKHDTSFAVMLDEKVEAGNCNFLQLVCNMPYYGWCVRSAYGQRGAGDNGHSNRDRDLFRWPRS
jgi:hypothetical protein